MTAGVDILAALFLFVTVLYIIVCRKQDKGGKK